MLAYQSGDANPNDITGALSRLGLVHSPHQFIFIVWIVRVGLTTVFKKNISPTDHLHQSTNLIHVILTIKNKHGNPFTVVLQMFIFSWN